MLRHLTICSILVTANIYVSGIVLDQPIQAVFNEYGVIGAKCVTVIIAGTGYVRVKFPNSTLATYIYHGNGMDPSAWKNLRRY